MKVYTQGTYLGTTNQHFKSDGVLVSETVYAKGYRSDWHYHENPYFAMILEGGSVEERKKQSFACRPGQLLCYDFDEQHRNSDYQHLSRNINIEFSRDWLKRQSLTLRSDSAENQFIRTAFAKILHECRIGDSFSAVSVELLTMECLGNSQESQTRLHPAWVKKIREILWDQWNETPSLQCLSHELDLHPVTISRYFSRYFRHSLGDYLRRIKTEKAIALLRSSNFTLFEIALLCGFADQSHFNRVFKNYVGCLPSAFRKF